VESPHHTAFTAVHLSFLDKLPTRAGVAIDNARLYSESVREREKLSHIVGEIADIVIVIGSDDRVVLINQSGLAALHLYGADSTFVGQPFTDALSSTPLLPMIEQAKAVGQMTVAEVELNDHRTYYTEFSPQPEIGWIMVMHD